MRIRWSGTYRLVVADLNLNLVKLLLVVMVVGARIQKTQNAL